MTARLKSSLVATSMLASQQKLLLASMLITNMAFAESLDRYNTPKTHRHSGYLDVGLPQRIKVHLSERVPDIGSV